MKWIEMNKSHLILVDKITSVFINEDDGKIVTIWLVGGLVQKIKHRTEAEARKFYERVSQSIKDY